MPLDAGVLTHKYQHKGARTRQEARGLNTDHADNADADADDDDDDEEEEEGSNDEGGGGGGGFL